MSHTQTASPRENDRKVFIPVIVLTDTFRVLLINNVFSRNPDTIRYSYDTAAIFGFISRDDKGIFPLP